jgi:predicted CopG family antitoxin
MATKTISIDLEAYARLKGVQKENESFSQTIKRVVRKPVDWKAWFKQLDASPLSDKAVAAIEAQVAQRRAPHNMGGRDALLGYNRTDRSGPRAKKRRQSAS